MLWLAVTLVAAAFLPSPPGTALLASGWMLAGLLALCGFLHGSSRARGCAALLCVLCLSHARALRGVQAPGGEAWQAQPRLFSGGHEQHWDPRLAQRWSGEQGWLRAGEWIAIRGEAPTSTASPCTPRCSCPPASSSGSSTSAATSPARRSRHSASRSHRTAASSTAPCDIGVTARRRCRSIRSPSSSGSQHWYHPHAPISSPTTACSRRPPLGATSSCPSALSTPLRTQPPRTPSARSDPAQRPRPVLPPARTRRAQPGRSSCDVSSPSTSSRARIAAARVASSHSSQTLSSCARSSRTSDCPPSLHGPHRDLFQGAHANSSTSPESPPLARRARCSPAIRASE